MTPVPVSETRFPLVAAIHIAETARGPMLAATDANAVPGRGLAADRYGRAIGTFSDWPKDHELTLVEAEVIEALARDHNVRLQPGETRRNLTTRNVRLNDLVGKQFRIGPDVICEGTRLCEPCAHLEALTACPGLCRLLAGRGGLRARILTAGPLRVGDPITALTVDARSAGA